MSFIAEYTLSNPILLETRQAVPEVTIEVEDEQPDLENHSRLILWTRGQEPALERFFRKLPDEPSITSFETLATLSERRLFRITLSPAGERGLTYVDAIELGITFLEIKATGETMEYRAQIPNREVLSSYRDGCDEAELSFTLRRLYRTDAEASAKYGLTPRQRDVLYCALERGYFEVPREISAAELAAEFEISSQALSALIRRGQKALVRSTIADGEGT